MKTVEEIKERLTEIKAAIRNLENKDALDISWSCEEYEVFDALVAERDTLLWVIENEVVPGA